MICWLAKALDARGDIGIARGGNRDGASEKTAAEAKGPRMDLSAYVCDGSMKTLRWFFVGAATKRMRAVSCVSTGGATVTFSHRLAAALRSLPSE
jgi:hypothetical protein